jgi:hypothetical protein
MFSRRFGTAGKTGSVVWTLLVQRLLWKKRDADVHVLAHLEFGPHGWILIGEFAMPSMVDL